MGGLAVNAWSVPAPTYDIDLCADLTVEEAPDLVRALEAEGFTPPLTGWVESVGAAGFREVSVGWPFQGGAIPAVVFIALDEFQKRALHRARRVELADGLASPILIPEDLMVYKLIAYRPKDRAAIERMLAVQDALDWPDVRRWAVHYGVESRFREALREAGIDEAAT
jgi:hypothetical protein